MKMLLTTLAALGLMLSSPHATAQSNKATGIDGRLPQQTAAPTEPQDAPKKKRGKTHAQKPEDFRAKVPGQQKDKKNKKKTGAAT